MTAIATVLGDLDPRRRLLIGIVGAPGSGKSTFAEEAARRLRAEGTSAEVLPMDGYHLTQARLRELGRRERMGAPDTFDTAGFVQTLRELRRDRDVAIPLFDREVEEPVPEAAVIRASTRVVLVEGNYLLLEEAGWSPVRTLLDRVVFLEIPDELRRLRLVARHVLFGKSESEAVAWVARVDDPNARRIERARHRADTVLDTTRAPVAAHPVPPSPPRISSGAPMTASPIHLDTTRLSEIERLPVPEYDRAAITAGIVHIGVGGFHRAHMAMAIDALLRQGEAREWGICGVGLLAADERMRDVMAEQDCLYTLMLKHPDGSREARVIGSIVEYLFAPDSAEAVIERMTDPAIRIVSLTITEGGYNVDRVSGEFVGGNPAVQADLAPDAVPTTVFGLVTEALRRRRERGVAPFTVQSCDNIQGNGDVAKRMFSAFAALRDPELGDWVREQVAFPNSMVDRITPVTTDADRAEVAERFGVADGWPVVAEPFFQWVIEDRFPGGRPPYEKVDAQLVEDVEPYELMKLRLLNASHQALAYFGYLMGYRFAHEATADALIVSLLRRYMEEEATPTLEPVPGVDLARYRETLIDRFQNPAIGDSLARLAAYTSDRIPVFLLPVVRANLEHDRPVALSAAIVASWARYAEAVDEQGQPIDVVDYAAADLTARARQEREQRGAFVRNPVFFGDLAEDPRFLEPYTAALDDLHTLGARAALTAVLQE